MAVLRLSAVVLCAGFTLCSVIIPDEPYTPTPENLAAPLKHAATLRERSKFSFLVTWMGSISFWKRRIKHPAF